MVLLYECDLVAFFSWTAAGGSFWIELHGIFGVALQMLHGCLSRRLNFFGGMTERFTPSPLACTDA